MTRPNFKLPKNHLAEIIPFSLVFLMSLFINKVVLLILGSVLLLIYFHFAFYILISWRILKNVKKNYMKEAQSKSQKSIFEWLYFLIIGFVIIWFSYFLNILDDEVPYVIGPIVYSLAVYFLSYKAFQLKATEIDGEVFKENDNTVLFEKNL
jgi:glucan phosphoethanolaminetransferase (alkaline phosphatase superfamily)